MLKRFLDYVSIFETNLSAAEWAWRILTVLVLAAGGTTAGLLAKGAALFESIGPVAWIAVGLLTSLLMALIFFFIKLGNLKGAEAEYTRAMAAREGSVNPLLPSFTDQVIRLEDLRLPGKQVHSHKQFKRCKFVGPGALAILGGTYVHDGFYESADIILLPDPVLLSGILVFENCTVEDCEFYRITILTNRQGAEGFQRMGARVAGLNAT